MGTEHWHVTDSMHYIFSVLHHGSHDHIEVKEIEEHDEHHHHA